MNRGFNIMRIVTLTGSHRLSGNTERLTKQLEQAILRIAEHQGEQIEIEHIPLAKAKLSTCLGCRACFDRGEQHCPQKDSLLEIYQTLLASDGVIAASPVYVEDVSGLMKNWIDRMAFVCHRPAFYGRSALLLTTSGGGATGRSLGTMRNALQFWGFDIAGKRNFRMGASLSEEALSTKCGEQIDRLAGNFVKAIQTKAALRPSMMSFVSFRVKQIFYRKKGPEMACDYDYWQAQGWLEQGASYFGPYRCNPVKRAVAHLLGGLAAVFFT